MEISEQIIRESPDIEAERLGLLERAKTLVASPYQLPAIQVAGLSPQQAQAEQLAQAGIGSFQPYLQAAGAGIQQGQQLAQTGARGVAGIDPSTEFAAAQRAMQSGVGAAGTLQQYAQAAGAGMPTIAAGTQTVGQAAGMAPQFTQAQLQPSQQMLQQAATQTQGVRPQFAPATGAIQQGLASGQQAIGMAAQAPGMAGFGQGIGAGYDAARQSQLATQQPGFGTAQQALTGGIGTLAGGAQGFQPGMTQDFMNPYQQQVIDEAIRQIDRQGNIARQGMAAQAVQAGAFGGTREGVQRAEMDRALAEQRNAAILGGLQSGFTQAQQTAQQAFEQQQQRQLAAGQGIGALGSQVGQLAGMQAGLGQQAAGQLAQAGQLQAGTTAQQAALQQQAAQFAAQQGQLGLQAGQALGGIEAQRAQLGLAGAGQLAGIGGQLGQQQLQQAQLGQAGTQLMGSLGAQQAQLGLLPAQIASQQGALAGQGAQLFGQMGQGIGALAGQQAGIGLQQAGTLGQLGQTVGTLGVQQAALGQAASELGRADINTLATLGQVRQGTEQARLDAARATQMQQTMAPYQQLGFLSDIYKGAPTTQMALTASSAPSPSPATQALGLGIAGVSAASGARQAGLF